MLCSISVDHSVERRDGRASDRQPPKSGLKRMTHRSRRLSVPRNPLDSNDGSDHRVRILFRGSYGDASDSNFFKLFS